MSRMNIFDLLKENNSIEKDAKRLLALFNVYSYASLPMSVPLTLYQFVDEFCFNDWAGKGRCLDIRDFLETLGIGDINYFYPTDIDSLTKLIEIIYNFWFLATNYLDHSDELFKRYDTEETLKKQMDECLSEYNFKVFYIQDEEKCIIIEDVPQITAAAEVVDGETAIEIIRYHHRQLAGDVPKKRSILKTLGAYLEGRKTDIQKIDNNLYNTITGALNNLNIRHNNVNPNNKGTYKKAVAEMLPEELESYYDEIYQLILFAILEMDNVSRLQDMKALIQRVNEKEIQ